MDYIYDWTKKKVVEHPTEEKKDQVVEEKKETPAEKITASQQIKPATGQSKLSNLQKSTNIYKKGNEKIETGSREKVLKIPTMKR